MKVISGLSLLLALILLQSMSCNNCQVRVYDVTNEVNWTPLLGFENKYKLNNSDFFFTNQTFNTGDQLKALNCARSFNVEVDSVWQANHIGLNYTFYLLKPILSISVSQQPMTLPGINGVLLSYSNLGLSTGDELLIQY